MTRLVLHHQTNQSLPFFLIAGLLELRLALRFDRAIGQWMRKKAGFRPAPSSVIGVPFGLLCGTACGTAPPGNPLTLVSRAGFEPATPCLKGRCSTN